MHTKSILDVPKRVILTCATYAYRSSSTRHTSRKIPKAKDHGDGFSLEPSVIEESHSTKEMGKGTKASYSGAEGLCQNNIYLNVVLMKNSNIPTESPGNLKTKEHMIGAVCTETSEYV